jgi:hypothetical protein
MTSLLLVSNLNGPLGHIHKLKMVLEPDNIKNVYDIQWHLLVLKFTVGRIKETLVADPTVLTQLKLNVWTYLNQIIFYGVKFILIGRSLYQYYR